MYAISFTTEMARCIKRIRKRGYDMTKLDTVIELLSTGNPLPAKYRDHALKGTLKDTRECHIEGDWLLTYKKYDNALIILATGTGTHSDLFGKNKR